MPREQKKRGRRLQKKPYEVDEKQKEVFETGEDVVAEDESTAEQHEGYNAFYGLLDSSQIEYFNEAVTLLETNSFGSDEEKHQFYEALWNEVEGIELKVITDPTGSKVFERLLVLASEEQWISLYNKFSGKFFDLSMQRFASHCLETLLNTSRAFVIRELEINPHLVDLASFDDNASVISAVIGFYDEIKSNISQLAFHPFGSHVIRSLLFLVSGRELDIQTRGSSILSNKKSYGVKEKSGVTVTHYSSFVTPKIFERVIIESLETIVNGMTTEGARQLALEPIASPLLQVILLLEDGLMKRDLLNILFPNSEETIDFLTVSFLEKLLDSSIGSHFLEKLLQNCPLSLAEYLYTGFFVPRLNIISKAKGFAFSIKALVSRLNEKPEKEQLTQAILQYVNCLSSQDITLLSAAIASSLNDETLKSKVGDKVLSLIGNDSEDKILLELLDFKDTDSKNRLPLSLQDSLRLRSIFAENLISNLPTVSSVLVASFLANPPEIKIKLAEHSIFSHVVESILRLSNLSVPTRRKLLNDFFGHLTSLALGPGSSRIVDAFNLTSQGIKHYRDKIAQELLQNRETIQRNSYGRKVWKNWNMDLYVRARYQWAEKK
ncbi:armadillo-type protein [Lipomyces japonicus]|uniref:armadillo-type protein n=1 Tax=Lipomyces japonicus TaxID=56871 RepID=UPI0034CD5F73